MTDKAKSVSKNIEAIYPLAPMQQGLLFHSLMHPGKGMYLLQYRHVMEMPDLDLTLFRQAWQQVVSRHEALRTSFVWQKQKRPLQVVHRQVELPVSYEDWSHLDSQTQEQKLDTLLRNERAEEFDFTRAPLMRVRLFKLAPDTYQFVRSYHHILMDAWCFSIIMMDFLNCYRALCRGQELQLPKPRPYRDFIRWLEQQDPEQHRPFWQQRLAGFTAPTPLGVDRPGLGRDAGEPVVDCVHRLSPEQTRRLQAAASGLNITLNTLVQGAWALLLSHYSGESDVLFGVTVSGRPAELEGMEAIVGLFINSLPLRWQVQGDQSLRSWLQALQRENLTLREHETVSLAQIQGWSEVDKQDLFHSLFVFENAPMDAGLRQENLEFIIKDAANRTHTNYPITVVVIPGEQLHLQLTYQTDRFSHPVVERMLAHFTTLLTSMGECLVTGEDSERRLRDIAMLSDTECHRQLRQWAEGPRQPVEPLYIERMEAMAVRHPGREALRYRDQGMSYSELNTRANLLAQQLIDRGVGPDTLVALLDERGPALLVMILAVLKAGAAWLPLDPKHPSRRIATVLTQGRPVLLVSSPELATLAGEAAGLVEGAATPHLTFDLSGQALEPCDNPGITVGPDHLAYVIFTSGSTGTPKGAMVTQEGMLNNMLGKFPSLALTDSDVIAQTASQCFDISVWQCLTGVILGARTVILPDCVAQDPEALVRAVAGHGITILEIVPSLMQGLLDQREAAAGLASLRWLLPTGEALPPVLARRWSECLPEIPMMNAYGPAECSDDVAFHPLVERLPDSASNVPIGRATANNRLYLLNNQMELLPEGAVGEIYVAGVGVGRGYLNEPERTAAVFLPDPFANDGSRLYRTGDLARFLPNGDLEYVGRSDHQVKVRGYRIELGEIESRLRQHDQVREAVVLACDDVRRAKVLVAYVVADSMPAVEALRKFIADTLPDYMVPAAFVPLPRLPLNANGKVDRKALPAPDFAAQSAASYVAPTTPLQQQLVSVWQEVLGLERIGIHDNFFELGGHSLLATQLIGQLSRQLDREVPLRRVFEKPTVAELAEDLESQQVSQDETGPRPQSRPEVLPLSFTQQRMWFLQQLEPDSPAYNLPGAVRLLGDVNHEHLRQALQVLVDQHEVLRTRFVNRDGAPVQIIEANQPVELPVTDLRSQEEAGQALHQALRRDAMASFDLEHGPLLRAHLYRVDDHEQVLTINCHHIIADGWSLRLIVEAFCHHYRTLQAGGTPAAEPLALQYVDYALWQRQWMEGEDCQRQLDYWRQRLDGERPLLTLASDYPRPEQPSQQGGRYKVTLPKALADDVKAFGQRQGRGNFITLLTAYQLVLHRFSGQDDILVGVPVANRHHGVVQSLIGCFVNTLVYRLRLDPAETLQALVARAHQQSVEAQAHQDLPFDYLIEQLGVERQLSHNPLFQAMFNYLPGLATDRFDLGDVVAELVDNRPDTAMCDLKLDVQELADGFELSFEYSRDLFAETGIAAMADYYQGVLAQLVRRPELPCGSVSLPADQHSLLTGAEQPEPADWLQRFRQQVELAPQQPALVTGQASLSYGELDSITDRWAASLRQRGIGPDDRVALCLERSQALPMAMVAILKAGAAYVPLDPGYPDERAAYILDHVGPGLCLTQSDLRQRVSRWNAGVSLVELAELESDCSSEPTAATPDQLAYVLYTSGSTGCPKGVAINRGNLANLLGELDHRLPLGHGDQVLALTTATFDIAVLELLVPLAAGATTVMADSQQARDAREIDQLLEQHDITVLQATPATWRLLVQHSQQSWQGLRAVAGGEALSGALAEAITGRGAELINGYGPTEATVYATFQPVDSATASVQVPIGAPIANTACYVLDDQLRPVPPGVAGELYLAGAGVGRGYFAAPELTAAAFLPDPFGTSSGGRMYRTGDQVRRTAQGGLEYLGRRDFQVKLRGFRIELGEIEAVLERHPQVEAAAVRLWGEGEQARMVGYMTGAADDDQLKTHLAAHLPDYMVPGQFVRLSAMPLNANGKVDRKALPQPEAPTTTSNRPMTGAEQRLADIWQEILQLDRVGPEDNFFNLGGHSLLAARVVARLAERHGVQLPLRRLFERPVLADLAAELDCDAGGEVVTIPPRSDDGPAPMHFTQQRLWFIDRFEDGSRAYNLSVALQVDGDIEPGVLQKALTALARRQHSLRTGFAEDDGQLLQILMDPATVAEVLAPVQHCEAEQLPDRLQAEAVHRFDLASAPLWRVKLYRLPAQGSVLQLTIHHMIADAWSLEILVRELDTLYRHYQANPGQPATGAGPLPALPLQFADVATWWQGPEGRARIEEQLDYWRDKLAGEVPLLDLPTDLPRPSQQTYNGERYRFSLPAELVDRLGNVCREQGLTVFTPLLTAWQLLLSRYSGQRDLWLGVPVAQRHHGHTEQLIGYFATTQVLRCSLAPQQRVAELWQQARQVTLEAQQYQDVPFEKLVEALAVDRDTSHAPLFQALFNLIQLPSADASEFAGIGARRLPVENNQVLADIALQIEQAGEHWHCTLEYNTDLFLPATMARYAEHFQQLLVAMLVQPESRLCQLTLDEPSPAQAPWNRTEAAIDWQQDLIARFERQAAATPGAIAVECGDQALSYGDLNRQANQLAHYLREQGVTANQLVAVRLSRGPLLVPTLLAVQKAGAAYLPLDPGHPAERLTTILRHARPALCLTESALPALEGDSGARTVAVDRLPLADYPDNDPRLTAQPGQLAYVIYTSGSTGRPKGVQISRANLLNFLLAMDQQLPLTDADRWLAATTCAFDISKLELFLPLIKGARIRLVETGEAADGEALFAHLENATVFQGTPASWQLLLQHRPDNWPAIRGLVGGEAVPAELANRLRTLGVALTVVYGPTETTVWSTCQALKEPVEGIAPIGLPLLNTQCYVLDDCLQPVPAGAVGELYIAGAGVAQGYQAAPELTAAAFLPDPFGTTPGRRMYRTGDLVRQGADGNLAYVGRSDFQIKVRGFRIEPGEIESLLRAYPGIREAVVMADEHQRIVAWVQADTPEARPDTAALRTYLEERVPAYMVPFTFVPVSRFALNTNGKIDRRALPRPAESDLVRHDYVAPTTELETQLADIWSELLALPRVGVEDSFFELGGHSLLAMRLISRVEERFGVRLHLRELFAEPTVAALARQVDTQGARNRNELDAMDQLLTEFED
ncbi:amino acid adenylation domain-containing protein [Marinobacter sp. DUT-3]|uniref:amino acid adenylation domain-containing protein n=1 Tax=Marinobacter sp. DUT-3 TaxID=3412036 RepID=UPI003D167116